MHRVSVLQPVWRVLRRGLSTNATAAPAESFLSGSSAVYIDRMHESWSKDPSSVHASWDAFFRGEGAGYGSAGFVPPPGLVSVLNSSARAPAPLAGTSAGGPAQGGDSSFAVNVAALVRAYQVRGHEMANLDPLGLHPPTRPRELMPETYNLEGRMDEVVNLQLPSMAGLMGESGLTLRALIERLEQVYCGNIGVEYMHIMSREKCNFLREKFETLESRPYELSDRKNILERLLEADLFEAFLAKKWPSAKRFGLEGGEALVPGMKAMLDRGVARGLENVVIGMPHRGRLNVLANVMKKDMRAIMSQFHPKEFQAGDDFSFSGDVKYHLGTSHDRVYPHGPKLHLSLLANPSHLEAVNPVVVGKARAKQYAVGDADRAKTMAVLLHGDAAFSGQGVVMETFDLGGLHDYTTGGTIHYVVNNQIGFTTNPRESRSSPYCTDVAKMVSAPIFHVNGEDPESVAFVSEIAMDYRQQFKEDVVVDIVCYRRHGHNEIDEPTFTHPRMYDRIKSHGTPSEVYAQRLLTEGAISDAELKEMRTEINARYEQAFTESKDFSESDKDWLSSHWHGFKSPTQMAKIKSTGVNLGELKDIGVKACTVPEEFPAHKKVRSIYKQRLKTVEKGAGIDWATAEALAFGSLLVEGHHVRISGQDVERGTFSHRHAILHSQDLAVPAGDPRGYYTPLNNLADGQEKFTATNSSLSEFAVMGFELGYSLENPDYLTIWEAQFGDFVNGAQIIIDQFISSGEAKWRRQSGLVLLLPHGYDGQGPEHSSCRLERFLVMSNEDPHTIPEMDRDVRQQIQRCNWQVMNCTTPANYFHALRRQIHREFRKPLVIASPKKMLRHPQAVSTLAEFEEGLRFNRVYPEMDTENMAAPDKVRKLLWCSGQVYYDLVDYRKQHGHWDVAIMRIEQLHPFPWDLVARGCETYPNASLCWVQEEPKNMGPAPFVFPRIYTASGKPIGSLEYAGRPAAASPATGNFEQHKHELDSLLADAFST